MRLFTAWVHIEDLDLDPVIPDTLSDTIKVKHRLNSFNTRDDYYTDSYIPRRRSGISVLTTPYII